MSSRMIILIAHGSRRSEANEEVHQLSRELAQLNPSDRILVAFLDAVAKPNIPETIDKAVAAGAQQITLLPYFLNTGNHVQKDIPAIVEAKRKEYPGVSIRTTQHFGAHPGVVKLLRDILETK